MNDRRSYGDLTSTSSSSSSSYSSPSSSYVTYTATPKWQALSDVWVFDLVNLRWKERYMFPQLARSYHSLVGWGNGAVAAFGGYQQDDNIGGEVGMPRRTLHSRNDPSLTFFACFRTIYSLIFSLPSSRLSHLYSKTSPSADPTKPIG